VSGARPGDEVPELACDLTAIPAAEAAGHRRALAAWRAATLATGEFDDGFAFEVEPSALIDIAAFIAAERHCCPFFTFRVTCAPGAPLRFEITGPPGAKEVLRGAAAR
jgi:hypothetical protein